MLIKAKAIEAKNSSLFEVALTRADAKFFGNAGSASGLHTIIGVEGKVTFDETGFVEFDANRAKVLNVGSGPNVFVVEIGDATHIILSSDDMPFAPETPTSELAEGDRRFLASCAFEELPQHICHLAKQLVDGIRAYSDDVLIEGKNRKWYTKPNNFIAITIQNKKKRLCIQVKDSLVLDQLKDVEVHKDKRYVRLFLGQPSEIHDVLKAVRASFLQF